MCEEIEKQTNVGATIRLYTWYSNSSLVPTKKKRFIVLTTSEEAFVVRLDIGPSHREKDLAFLSVCFSALYLFAVIPKKWKQQFPPPKRST